MTTTEVQELRSKIKGPVFPVVVPFDENEEVDHAALKSYVDFLIGNGARIVLLTVGTSRYNLLSTNEMMSVNETVAGAAAGRAAAIVAGPGPNHGSTRKNIEFAKRAGDAGADGMLVLYPERWYGDEPVVEFFREVAGNTDIGIMIHAVPMRDGFGGVRAVKHFDADLIGKVLDTASIAGIKEENGDRGVFEETLRRFKDRLPVIGAGGCMRRFLKDHLLGSITYLVGIGSLKPRLAVEFYKAVMDGNIPEAERFAAENEDPYFQYAVSVGWHRALKESLCQLDLMSPHERSPFDRISKSEREKLAEIHKQCGW